MGTSWKVLPTFFLILKTILFLLSSPTATNSLLEVDSADRLIKMESQIRHLSHKNVLLDNKNVHQDREIRLLKTLVSNIITKQKNNNNDEDLLMIQKRPVRLLPPHLYKKKEVKKTIDEPPSSCKDLNELGHTLNGIYLVKIRSITSSSQSKIVTNAIFCDFMEDELPSSSSYSVKQSSLGYVDLKLSEKYEEKSVEPAKNRSRIYFHVQIGNGSSTANGVLHFDRQVANVGGGMDLKKGVFTVPKAGLYTFFFSIAKNSFDIKWLEIDLRVNGVQIGHSLAGSGFFSAPATLQTYLKLRKGDRVDLWKSYGSLNHICAFYCHHFTGFLIEED